MFKKLEILNTYYDVVNYNILIEIINNKIFDKSQIIIDFPNAYINLLSYKNISFNKILHCFDLLVPDGIGIYIASKLLYGKNGFPFRTVSTDFWVKIFCQNLNVKFYLIGGAEGSREKIYKKFENSGKFVILNHEHEPIKTNYDIDMINSCNADILLVALGTPRQEDWIVRNKDLINVPIIIGVGSGLDFLAGVKKRAPLWMRKIGLEWFYRLFQEPKRLWKRYLIGIPVFMFYVLGQKVNLILKKTDFE